VQSKLNICIPILDIRKTIFENPNISEYSSFTAQHFLVISLKTGIFLSKNFHETAGLLPVFFSFQKCLDRAVPPGANSNINIRILVCIVCID
jgi:hypothetical protein